MTEKSNIPTQRTTGNKLKKGVVGTIAVIFLFIGITASFVHKAWPEDNPKINDLNEERSSLKIFWNKKESDHDKLLQNDLISKNQYFKIKTKNKLSRSNDFKKISKKRKQIAYNFSFKGRSSLSYWLWVFGIFLTLFIVSCFLAIKDIRLKSVGLLKWYEPIATIAFIFVSLFWLYHTLFKTSNDFGATTYTFYLIFILIPISIFIYHFLRRFILIEERLLENIKDLVSHVLKNTKEESENEKWEVLDKVSKNGE